MSEKQSTVKVAKLNKNTQKNNNKDCQTHKKFEDYKNYISNLLKSKKLDSFKYDSCYFETMGNQWLIDKYISKYGIVDDEVPENTLKAYQKAMDNGYAILISVQMLCDDTLVCYKYKSLAKLNNENGYLCNTTLNELKQMTYNSSGESVPTLDEALNLIAGNTPVVIELLNETAVGKCEELLSRMLNDYMQKYKCHHKVALMAINPYSLEWFYRNCPWITRIIKSCSFVNTKYYATLKTKHLKKLKFHKIAHADFVCYNSKDLPSKYIKKCKPVGVLAYNVTSQEEYEKVLKYSDNIMFWGFKPTI